MNKRINKGSMLYMKICKRIKYARKWTYLYILFSMLEKLLLWWAYPKVTPKVYPLSCAPHLLHEDDPLDSLQHHEPWGVCLTT
jgi:hypothetical protein